MLRHGVYFTYWVIFGNCCWNSKAFGEMRLTFGQDFVIIKMLMEAYNTDTTAFTMAGAKVPKTADPTLHEAQAKYL